MNINTIKYQNVNFKSIQLTPKEYNKSDKILREIKKTSNNSNRLKEQLYTEIFKKHIIKEAKEKAGRLYYQEDVFQDFCLKFFEIFQNVKNITTETIIITLNQLKPNKKSLQENYRFNTVPINANINRKLISNDILSPTDKPTQKTENLKSITLKDMTDTVPLTYKEKIILDEIQKKQTQKAISKKLNVSPACIGYKIGSIITKIQEKNGLLPQEFNNFIMHLTEEYQLSKQETQQLKKKLIKMPNIIQFGYENIINNVNNISSLLDVKPNIYFRKGMHQTTLLFSRPETILEKISKLALETKQSKKDIIKVALKQPQLFYLKTETIMNNINELANRLNITHEDVIKIALRHPNLFFQNPDTIMNNIKEISNKMQIPIENIIKMAYTESQILYIKPSTVIKKIKIDDFYKYIQGNKQKYTLHSSSYEYLYKKILSYLIKEADTLNRRIKVKDLDEYLSKQNKIYEFQLPEHEIKEEFIKFIEKYSIKTFKKQRFKFI